MCKGKVLIGDWNYVVKLRWSYHVSDFKIKRIRKGPGVNWIGSNSLHKILQSPCNYDHLL